jgi:hypothetical protein
MKKIILLIGVGIMWVAAFGQSTNWVASYLQNQLSNVVPVIVVRTNGFESNNLVRVDYWVNELSTNVSLATVQSNQNVILYMYGTETSYFSGYATNTVPWGGYYKLKIPNLNPDEVPLLSVRIVQNR